MYGVVLVTSMYFIETRNVSSFGMYSLTLWYNVTTINELSCDRPEVISRFLVIMGRVFFMIGWSTPFVWITIKNFWIFASFRIKVDVLRRRSLPKICTVPSANGKMEFPVLSGVNTLPLHWAFWRGVQMRPSPPFLQCLRPQCLLSRFSPRTMHSQKKPGKTFEPNRCSRDSIWCLRYGVWSSM